jgi:predicted DNA-binding mobile mystery protein A
MMEKELTSLRATELNLSLEAFRAAQVVPRPRVGWIRTIREALGISAGELGRVLGVSRQLPLQFEKAEADDSITLKSLRNVANALGCDLVYALVPRAASMEELVENRAGVQARKDVKRVERSIGSESQTMARTDDAVEPEGLVIENEVLDPHFCD